MSPVKNCVYRSQCRPCWRPDEPGEPGKPGSSAVNMAHHRSGVCAGPHRPESIGGPRRNGWDETGLNPCSTSSPSPGFDRIRAAVGPVCRWFLGLCGYLPAVGSGSRARRRDRKQPDFRAHGVAGRPVRTIPRSARGSVRRQARREGAVKSYCDSMGLLSLLASRQRLQCAS